MSQNPQDPAGTTQQFQRFQQQGQPEKSSGGPSLGFIIGIGAVVALVAILVIAFVALG
ncbi:hypothetical protein [Spirillospora sp. NPDC047279]|uniref:hypothetical protein n=1 Tax=Spirillospora sp. NPDC047279 TaxID=3155478 RepID=UPI0033E8A9FF